MQEFVKDPEHLMEIFINYMILWKSLNSLAHVTKTLYLTYFFFFLSVLRFALARQVFHHMSCPTSLSLFSFSGFLFFLFSCRV
jgi:hypothetical protein